MLSSAVRLAPNALGSLRVTFPPCPQELAKLRASLRAWLEKRAYRRQPRSSLFSPLTRHARTPIQHANWDQPDGAVTVLVEEVESRLMITVRDYGRFMPPPRST